MKTSASGLRMAAPDDHAAERQPAATAPFESMAQPMQLGLAGRHGITQRRLQALVDNSPRTAQLAERAALVRRARPANAVPGAISDAATAAAPVAPLQMRKAATPELAALNKPKLRATDRGTVANAGEPEERRQLIWHHLNGVYDASVNKGRTYWAKVEQRTHQFLNDRPKLESDLSKIRAEYDARYQAYYTTQTHPDGSVSTFGTLDKEGGAPPTDSKPYENSVDTARGQITAASNYAGKDEARRADVANRDTPGYKTKGLPNSEVLWRQYFEASRDRFWILKDSRAQEAMQELTSIKRQNVVNSTTLQTGYIALPDNVDFTAPHSWQPGNDDFLAMIGTPNCAPAAHMLADHIDEMGGKTIRHIRATGEGDASLSGVALEIEFETLPAVREALEAEAELEAGIEALSMMALAILGETA